MYDVIIVGAGPSGLMCAIEASKNKKVLIIERNEYPGKKLLITGGGRSNITNLKDSNSFLDEVNYNKKMLYSTINKFGPEDIYNFFVSNGVMLKEEDNNEIFPVSNSSKDILDALIKNCNEVDFKYGETVLDINSSDIFSVVTDKGKYSTKNVVVATGGISYKNTGSCGDHLKFADKLNQPVIPLFPAETGIILKEKNSLAGTSLDDVEVMYLKYKTSGNLMFTHTGLSGSSIMKMSEYVYKNDEKRIVIDLLPNYPSKELISMMNNYDREKELSSFLNTLFSKRFTNYLLGKLGIDKKIKSITKTESFNIVNLLKEFELEVKSVKDIEQAYVTGGGIDLKYINTKTMESKVNTGIYFIGEALDIHGPIGGYNLTLAFSTGYTAGVALCDK